MPIDNCEKCGAVFARVDRLICPECVKNEEAEFQKAVEWLRANPGKTISALSESTGIASSEILRWIREQRLAFSGSGLIVCKKCGKLIESGAFCEQCKAGLSKEMSDQGRGPESAGSKHTGLRGGMHYTRNRRERRR